MANQNLTAQQRALLFGASTRQHFQMLGSQTVSGGAQTVNWRVPKARLLQGIKVLFEADVKITGASKTFTDDVLAPYRICRRLSVDFNNGFMPVVAGTHELALWNCLRPMPEMIFPSKDGSTLCEMKSDLTASTGGTSNKFSFTIDVPLTLNERDPVGMFLAQNAETNIDIVCDIANPSEIIGNESGYTVEITSLKITPMTTTFSIPANANAFPDLSVLKIVDSRTETFAGAGQNHVKLPVGMIYRKMILVLQKNDGSPMLPEDINGNIELVLNTADIPYSISPAMLRAVNKMQNGCAMPDGVYFFDFSYQGVCNYGGSRDYIDTETVSELTLRFNTQDAGKLTLISEKLSRLV